MNPSLATMTLFEEIISLLEKHHCAYVVKDHKPTSTSQDSARERGEPLQIGAKALVLKTDERFILAVLPADHQLDAKKAKKIFSTRNLRFATPEELREKTGCEKGAVPPFGKLLGLDMVVDLKLFENEWMAFNAGSLEKSIKMKTADFRVIVQPPTGEFSK